MNNEEMMQQFIELGDCVESFGQEIDEAVNELQSNLNYALERLTDEHDKASKYEDRLNDEGQSWLDSIQRAIGEMESILNFDLENAFRYISDFDASYLKPDVLTLKIEIKGTRFLDPEKFVAELTDYVKFLVGARGIGDKIVNVEVTEEEE